MCPNGQITRDQIKAAMRKQRGLMRCYTQYCAMLRAIANAQGWKSEREALLERAGVRTGTDNRGLVEQAVPGARLLSERSVAQKVSSPFVDDAVRDFLAEESKA